MSAQAIFTDGFCSCFDDCSVCAAVGLAPFATSFVSLPNLVEGYCQYQALQTMGEPTTMPIISIILLSPLAAYIGSYLWPIEACVKQQMRATIKRRAGVEENCFCEYMVHCLGCISPCATCQELRAANAINGASAPTTTTTTTKTTSYSATGAPVVIEFDA